MVSHFRQGHFEVLACMVATCGRTKGAFAARSGNMYLRSAELSSLPMVLYVLDFSTMRFLGRRTVFGAQTLLRDLAAVVATSGSRIPAISHCSFASQGPDTFQPCPCRFRCSRRTSSTSCASRRDKNILEVQAWKLWAINRTWHTCRGLISCGLCSSALSELVVNEGSPGWKKYLGATVVGTSMNPQK